MMRHRYQEASVQRYQEIMRQSFGSDAEMEDARLALAQSMRDRASRDQDEASRALSQAATDLREGNPDCPVSTDTPNTMELAATLRRQAAKKAQP